MSGDSPPALLADRPGAQDEIGAGTLPGLLVASARAAPEAVALREKEFGVWQEITWAGYLDRVRRFSLGLRALGVVPGDTVAIIGDNRPEWVIAELAAQALGAVPVGIYQDSVLDELRYVLEASGEPGSRWRRIRNR